MQDHTPLHTNIGSEYPFDGFAEKIAEPLKSDDPLSFNRIKCYFLEDALSRNTPFSFLISKLTTRALSEPHARKMWENILDNKKDMERKLGRRIDIQTAAIDYALRDEHSAAAITTPPRVAEASLDNYEWAMRASFQSHHIEKLKEEMLRARRYNHSLSAIMIDIDYFSTINEIHSYSIGDEILALIAKIISKSIRTVDAVSRHTGDVFLVILPNTNKREALELAERIRTNITKRTKRIEMLARAVTATLSVAQCEAGETSADFISRMHDMLEKGKNQKRDTVYT